MTHLLDELLDLVDDGLGLVAHGGQTARVLQYAVLEELVDRLDGHLVGVPLEGLLELLDAVVAELQLGQAEGQIAALALRGARRPEAVAQLLDERLALLVALDEREQVGDDRAELVLLDVAAGACVAGALVESAGHSAAAAAATQLTDDVGHGVVDDEAVVALRELLEEELGERAYLRIGVDGAQGDLVDLAAGLDHLLENEMREDAYGVDAHLGARLVAQRQVQVARPRLERIGEAIDQVADAHDELGAHARIARLLHESEDELQVVARAQLGRQAHELDEGERRRQLHALVRIGGRMAEELDTRGHKLSKRGGEARVGLREGHLEVDNGVHEQALDVLGALRAVALLASAVSTATAAAAAATCTVTHGHLLLGGEVRRAVERAHELGGEAAPTRRARLVAVVGQRGVGRRRRVDGETDGAVLFAQLATLELAHHRLVEEDEQLGGQYADERQEALQCVHIHRQVASARFFSVVADARRRLLEMEKN